MEDKSTDKQLENSRKIHPNSLANLEKAKPWKPGHSGNPGGRTPNKKYLSEALLELFNRSPDEALEIIKAIASKAKKGDVGAVREIWDRTEGKIADKIEGTDVPVTIILKRAEDRDATE